MAAARPRSRIMLQLSIIGLAWTSPKVASTGNSSSLEAPPLLLPVTLPSAGPTTIPVPTTPPSVERASPQPSLHPSLEPSLHPSLRPSLQPTMLPSMQPSSQPSPQPSSQPSSLPSPQPSLQPSLPLPTLMPTPIRVVATPDALPLNGAAEEVMTWVTLSCDTPNATIRYSLNGRDPSESIGEPYETSFAVYADECQPDGCTIRARGFKDGWQASEMRVIHFTIEPVAPDPVFTPSGGTFVGFVDVLLDVGVAATAIRSSISSGSSSEDSKTTLRWTTDKNANLFEKNWDGSVASPGDTIRLPEDFKSEDSGGAQTIQLRCLAMRPGSVLSPAIDATYTILARTAPVTFTPEYDDPQLPGAYLALASATSGATIYYTTDGTTDPVAPGTHDPVSGKCCLPVPDEQRQCVPGTWSSKDDEYDEPEDRCELHVDKVGTTTFRAIAAKLPDFAASLIATTSVTVENRLPPPVFLVQTPPTPPLYPGGGDGAADSIPSSATSSTAGTSDTGASLVTYTDAVTFSFACSTDSPVASIAVRYSVVGTPTEPPPVALGVGVTWTRLGTVTIRAVTRAPGWFESPEVEHTFVVVEAPYDEWPIATFGQPLGSESDPANSVDTSPDSPSEEATEDADSGTSAASYRNAQDGNLLMGAPEASFWEQDPTTPALQLHPFTRTYQSNDKCNSNVDSSSSSSSGCSPTRSRVLTGRMVVLDNPGRFLSVVPPEGGCTGRARTTTTAAAYRHPAALAEATAASTGGGGTSINRQRRRLVDRMWRNTITSTNSTSAASGTSNELSNGSSSSSSSSSSGSDSDAWAESFAPFARRPRWHLPVGSSTRGGWSYHNLTALAQRAWADEAVWQAYLALPDPIHDGSRSKFMAASTSSGSVSPFTGCMLAVSSGLLKSSSNSEAADDSSQSGCDGHVVSAGSHLVVNDLSEHYSASSGVVRNRLSVDFGLRNGSWVVGYVPRAEVNTSSGISGSSSSTSNSRSSSSSTHSNGSSNSTRHTNVALTFNQLLTGEAWLVRKGQIYVTKALAHAGMSSGSAAYKEAMQSQLARVAMGFDARGRFIVVQIDGSDGARGKGGNATSEVGNDSSSSSSSSSSSRSECASEESGRSGATLLELAQLALDAGCVQAVALASGSQANLALNAALVSRPARAADAPPADWPVSSMRSATTATDSSSSDSTSNSGTTVATTATASSTDVLAWQEEASVGALVCVHLAPPPVYELDFGGDVAAETAAVAAGGIAYGWPWSPPEPPTPTPSISLQPSGQPTREPWMHPTPAPVSPAPTPRRMVPGFGDDDWSATHGAAAIAASGSGYLNSSLTDAETEELAFYRTSTSMLILLLFLSGALHCWTWAEATRDAERRQEAHFRAQREKKRKKGRRGGGSFGIDDYDDDDDDDDFYGDEIPEWEGDEDAEQREYRRKGQRPPPIFNYGGSTYGTKKPTAPVEAVNPQKAASGRNGQQQSASSPGGGGGGLAGRLIARGKRNLMNGVASAQRSRRRGGGYAPVHAGGNYSGGVDYGDDDDDDFGIEMGDATDGSWHNNGGGMVDIDDDDDEGFEERFKRMDRERAALVQLALNEQVQEAKSRPGAFLGGLLRQVLGKTFVTFEDDGGEADTFSPRPDHHHHHHHQHHGSGSVAAARGGGPHPGSESDGGEQECGGDTGMFGSEVEEVEAEINPFSQGGAAAFSDSGGSGHGRDVMLAPLEVAAAAVKAQQTSHRSRSTAGRDEEVSPHLEY